MHFDNWLLPQCQQLRNRFPVIKPSVSASIRDIFVKEICSGLNIVKLIYMLEMTCGGPGKNCNGTDKAINRYNGYTAK